MLVILKINILFFIITETVAVMQSTNSDAQYNDELTDSQLVTAVQQIEGMYCILFLKLHKNIHFTLFNCLDDEAT